MTGVWELWQEYLDSGDEEVIALGIDCLFETLDFVHNESFFSRIDCVNCWVEGDKADAEERRETAELVH